MRNTGYSGLLLSSITQLSYSTFIQKADSKLDAPFVVLQVDNDGDGLQDDHIIFNVRFQTGAYMKGSGIATQGPIKEKVWQTWDAFNGGWFTGTEKAADTSTSLYSLAAYVKEHPNARIVNDSTGGGYVYRLADEYLLIILLEMLMHLPLG
jgi:hypothetical protein